MTHFGLVASGALGKKDSHSVSEVAILLSLQIFSVQGVVKVAVAEFQQCVVPLLPLNAEQKA